MIVAYFITERATHLQEQSKEDFEALSEGVFSKFPGKCEPITYESWYITDIFLLCVSYFFAGDGLNQLLVLVCWI